MAEARPTEVATQLTEMEAQPTVAIVVVRRTATAAEAHLVAARTAVGAHLIAAEALTAVEVTHEADRV